MSGPNLSGLDVTNTFKAQGRVLTIAGSDSGGGAGIQADIKTISALGGYAMTAITALTAQDTVSIQNIVPVEADFVALQARMCLEDIGADAIKIGMLPSREVLLAVCGVLGDLAAHIPVVLDPILKATTGRQLATDDALSLMKGELLGRCTVVTPNIREAELLTGLSIDSVETMKEAAAALCEMGAGAALVTGGHLESFEVHDVLVSAQGRHVFSAPRLDAANTHGTGCTLSSALATGLAFGKRVEVASEEAIAFVRKAIRYADNLGAGSGPLNHQFDVRRKPQI